jgi:hypothetical protein
MGELGLVEFIRYHSSIEVDNRGKQTSFNIATALLAAEGRRAVL